jgi:hypothetical protein
MITDPLQDQGSACLGGRKKVTAQNVIAQDKKQTTNKHQTSTLANISIDQAS